jgi:ferredoxin
MQIKVNQEQCRGHALCFAAAPDIFVLDDEGYISVDGIVTTSEGRDEDVRRGVNSCPERVYTIVEQTSTGSRPRP